jgi:hypothetical protein
MRISASCSVVARSQRLTVDTVCTGLTMPKSEAARYLAYISLALGLLLGALPLARAADVLGAYIGGSIGQVRIDTGNLAVAVTNRTADLGTFTENHSGYKLMFGARPISVAGAELEYFGFGHTGKTFTLAGVNGTADVKMNGLAVFGAVYLQPVPVLDVFVKAGFAWLQVTSNVTATDFGVDNCPPISARSCPVFSQRNTTTNTSAATGAGVQMKVGRWAMRAEYERFRAAGGAPGLASVGASWRFF